MGGGCGKARISLGQYPQMPGLRGSFWVPFSHTCKIEEADWDRLGLLVSEMRLSGCSVDRMDTPLSPGFLFHTGTLSVSHLSL